MRLDMSVAICVSRPGAKAASTVVFARRENPALLPEATPRVGPSPCRSASRIALPQTPRVEAGSPQTPRVRAGSGWSRETSRLTHKNITFEFSHRPSATVLEPAGEAFPRVARSSARRFGALPNRIITPLCVVPKRSRLTCAAYTETRRRLIVERHPLQRQSTAAAVDTERIGSNKIHGLQHSRAQIANDAISEVGSGAIGSLLGSGKRCHRCSMMMRTQLAFQLSYVLRLRLVPLLRMPLDPSGEDLR